MPLPGGPSDKLGNRYELRWIVRELIDLITGRIEWLRIEPPGDDAIEFRCRSREGEAAYQVKRGISGGGHWSLAALHQVLDGFGVLLTAEPSLQCVFASAHAAPELQELCERARASRSHEEFAALFLEAQWLEKAWDTLCSRWGVDPATAWGRIRRIRVTSIGEQELQENTDAILQLLFDAPPETTRAVLTSLALDSIHNLLHAEDVAKHLGRASINRREIGVARVVAPVLTPPPSSGVRRSTEIERIASHIAAGRATVFLEGLSGIGKSTVAAQFATTWEGPACWLDCALLSSPAEAVTTLGEFLAHSLSDSALAQAAGRGVDHLVPVGRLAGRVLATKKCLVVWDGLDGVRQAELRPLINAIATTIPGGGAQVVTAQENRESGQSTVASFTIDRLDKPTLRRLLIDAFPNARAADIEAADELTSGHPYMVQLLVDAASILDLGTALDSMRSTVRAEALLSTHIGQLPESSRKLLRSLAWLAIPFGTPLLERLGGGTTALTDLARRHLVTPSGGGTYSVHDLVAQLVMAATPDFERTELHQRAALALRSLEHPSRHEVQALLRHARAASMSDIVREAGTFLLQHETDVGTWWVAREAAEALVRDGSRDYYPHFVLGKSCRMTRELEEALPHYEAAEKLAPDATTSETARFERASVLIELGRRNEAEPLYRAMLDSTQAATRAGARVTLALGMLDGGDLTEARRLLEEALRISTEAFADRARADVHHALAHLEVVQGHLKRARKHLREAHAIRYALTGPEAFDVLGSFELYRTALMVEQALGDRAGARSAAHALWRYAIMSGSIPWETSACEALCIIDPNEKDPEVTAALAHLRVLQADSSVSLSLRVTILTSLALCEWSLAHHEASLEVILVLLALGNEQRADVPMFGHLTTRKKTREKIVPMPFGYGLLLPPGAGKAFIDDTLARVLARRPELCRHAKLLVAKPSETTATSPTKRQTLTKSTEGSGGRTTGKRKANRRIR